MTVINKFNVNSEQVTLDADIIENMSANDVSYDDSTQYDENTVGDKLSELEYDVTENNDGITFTSLSELLSSKNLSTLIPTSVRHGGMSIRFVQSSDNKYVQYRLTLSKFTDLQFIDIINWRKTVVPIPDVAIVTGKLLKANGNEYSTSVSSFACTDYIFAVPGTTIYVHKPSPPTFDYTLLCFYDANKRFISAITDDNEQKYLNVTLTDEMIPDKALFFRANIDPSNFKLTTSVEPNYARFLIDWVEKYKTDAYISKIPNAILQNDGTISTNSSWNYYVTDYFPIGEQVSVLNLAVRSTGNAANVALCFYDENFNFISYLAKDTTVTQLTLTADDIPSNAVYGRSPVTVDGRVFLPKNLTKKYNNIPLELAKLNTVSYNDGTIIDSNGNISDTTALNFKTSNYCFVKEGLKLFNLHRGGSEEITVYFYDKNFIPISYLSNSEPYSNLTLNSSNIPISAKYFRATFSNKGYITNYKNKIINELDLISLNKNYYKGNIPFNYELALAMDKSELRSMVETTSNGRCTVLYDDYGYPSLMYKIPKISIGALAPTLGELSDVHPAFIVNGVEKDIIYMAVFETCLYQGHYVSWFGLPSEGKITIPNLRQGIANKGNGWHLETIYERSLLVLLTMNLNSSTPTGNTNKGMSHLKNWEYCQLYDNTLPGDINHQNINGVKWVNGTQPSSWSHNKELWGIQDVIGGFHEICDLMKLVNGKIYIASDNNFFKKGDDISTFENSWIDFGVAFDYIDGNIVLNTSVTNPMDVPYYVEKTYSQIGCTIQYDALPESIRKKMCLLLMASRLTSSDDNPIFEFEGRFGIANHKELCYGVFGGAEEYTKSGLGSQITAYPIDNNDITGHNAHFNMGSRMVYIE